MSQERLYIGLMSGTSMDAVDCALLDLGSQTPQVLEFISPKLPPAFKLRLLGLATNSIPDLRELGSADIEVAVLFAQTVEQLLDSTSIDRARVTAIGSHGQTIWHEPPQSARQRPFSMQIGDPSTLAELTGLTVVADFRQRDMAAGGQGAPIVPAFHQAFFSVPERNRIILNLGGIANITLLPTHAKPPLGFDTGPASVLLDAWIKRQRGLDFDESGRWAATGSCNPELLAALLDEPYFQQPPPKSTGRELLNMKWLERKLATVPTPVKPEDVQATLLELTAETVARAILTLVDAGEVVVCGGGARNAQLLACLQEKLPGFSLQTSAALGIHADSVEAAAFAWLAHKTLNRETIDLRAFTGSRKPVIAGGIYWGTTG